MSQFKRGNLITTSIAIAAGLAGAALIYMKHRGVDPKREAKRIGSKAKSAGAILSGESHQAYQDVRRIIIDEVVSSNKPITKSLLLKTMQEILVSLKQHGSITKDELAVLSTELKADWKSMYSEAKVKEGEA